MGGFVGPLCNVLSALRSEIQKARIVHAEAPWYLRGAAKSNLEVLAHIEKVVLSEIQKLRADAERKAEKHLIDM